MLALAVAGLSYGAASGGASDFLAVYVTGLLVGARVPRHRRNIRTFHAGDAYTELIEIVVFCMIRGSCGASGQRWAQAAVGEHGQADEGFDGAEPAGATTAA